LRARLEREQAKRKRGEPTLPSSVGEERSTNPFLRTSEAEVCTAAARHAGRDLPDRVAVFAELRAWKNAF
jgi:hydroxyacylglutathione hydrolase